MNKITVIGNLGKDCTTNDVNGKKVINFSVADTEKFKDSQGNQKDKTNWFECAYWTDKTGITPYLKKGSQVYVEGKIEIKTYTKSDGSAGTSLGVRVSSIQLLGGKDSEQSATHTPREEYGASKPLSDDLEDPDLPF